jgi:hypothetical protein
MIDMQLYTPLGSKFVPVTALSLGPNGLAVNNQAPGPYIVYPGPYYLPIAETFWDGNVTSTGVVDGTNSLEFWNPLTECLVGYLQNGGNYMDGTGRAFVIPFQLPYLNPGQAISAATVAFNYVGKNGSPLKSIDLYGLNRTVASTGIPAPIAGDWYVGSDDTANTLLEQNIITPSTLPGIITITSQSLINWLNEQYQTIGAGGYVFLRLSAQALENQSVYQTNYRISTSYADATTPPNRQNVPTLSIVTTGALQPDAGKLVFSFTLGSPAIVSAGVYNASTNGLLRTVLANVPGSAGVNCSAWDGNDDFGNSIAAGAYVIKVSSLPNFAPVWEGTIGNTSASNTGQNVYRALQFPLNIAIDPTGASGNAYLATGYQESRPNFTGFPLATPQVPFWMFPNNSQSNPYTQIGWVATDGVNVYYAKVTGGMSGNGTYIFATNMAGTALSTFSGGSTPSGSNQIASSVFDYDNTSGQPNPCTGLSVEKNGNFAFSSHSNLGVVRAFNKTTGAAASTASTAMTTPGASACDINGYFYVISGTSVLKYAINTSTAALTLAHTYSGFNNPIAIACDNGTNLYVTDSGSVQQIILINTATNTITGTLGTLGGITANGPAVTNATFMFDQCPTSTTTGGSPPTQAGIACAPDGSFWFTDAGNYRMLHYKYANGAFVYIEQIAFIPNSYSTAGDPNNPSRHFNTYLEFAQNFNEPLDNGTNGSWKLVNNWFAGLNPTNYSGFGCGIASPVTLNNGRTYAMLRNLTTGNFDCVELASTGVRQTGTNWGQPGSPHYTGLQPAIHSDGSLKFMGFNSNSTSACTATIQALTGFASGNPQWGPARTIINIKPNTGTHDPLINTFNIFVGSRVRNTSDGNFAVIDDGNGAGFHLGILNTQGTAYVGRAWRTTPQGTAYAGKFPVNGQYDNGNQSTRWGSVALVTPDGNFIVCGFYGEFWKGGYETNQWLVFDKTGLYLGKFGTMSNVLPNWQTTSIAGVAGNSYAPPDIFTNPVTGLPTLIHNDESNHSASHRWSIGGLAPISFSGSGSTGQVLILN